MLRPEPAVSTDQRLNHKVAAGLADAGLSSAATFVVGIIAIRTLSADDLGVYSVLFAAFLLGSLVPSEAYFYPRQVIAIGVPPEQRTDGLARAIASSIGYGLIGCLAVAVSALVIYTQADPSLLLPEAAAAAGLVAASPAQDYLRRILHVSEQSWKATVVSAGQLGFVVLLAGGAYLSNLALGQLPLMILLAANCLSIVLGLVLAGSSVLRPQSIATRRVHGGFVLRSAAFFVGGGLVGSLVMSRLAGPAVVGYAEAARTAAQPVLVVGFGLVAALASRSLKGIQSRDVSAARQVNRLFFRLMALTTLGFLVLYSVPWSARLVARLMPAAFEIGGLAVVSVAANFLMALSVMRREQLINGGQEKEVALADTWGAVFPVLGGLLSPWLGAFGRGVGLAAQCGYRLVGFNRLWRPIFGEPPTS